MIAFENLISSIINIIITVCGNSYFLKSVLFAPFLIWLFRQIFTLFNVLINESYKRW